MIRTLTGAMLIALLLAACGDEDSTGPSGGSDDYLPLAVGNYWDYDMNGTLVSSAGDTTYINGQFSRDMFGTTDHQQGFQVYAVEQQTQIDAPDTTVIYADTVYVYETEEVVRVYQDTVTADYTLYLQMPLDVGDSWTSDSLETMTVMSLTSTVETSLGTYSDCAHLQLTFADDPDRMENLYLAPGVGLVKQTFYDEEPAATESITFSISGYSAN